MSNPLPGSQTLRTSTPRNIYHSKRLMSFDSGHIDSANSYDGSNVGAETELRQGTIMARITSTKKWVPCRRTMTDAVGRGATALVVDNARAFKVGDTIKIDGATDVLKIEDLDAAASTGLAVYLHMDELGANNFGHLESVTAGNADGTVQTLGGAVIKIEDDDAAATGGFAVYFDEDAANPDERFLAAVPTLEDAFVMTTDGRAIRIKYHATPSTPGVLVYFDDDAATATERLLFVSPTNVDGFVNSDDIVGQQSRATRTSTNTISAINYATNTLTVTAATWNAGDQVYSDSLAGSETARLVLDECIDLYDDDTRAVRDMEFGRGVVSGELNYDAMLGDIAAILADENNMLKSIRFYDDGVQV